MGYAIMLALKEPYVCETDCKHKDCAQHRNFATNAKCSECKEKIEPGEAYYGTKLDDLQHFKCA